MGVDIRLLLTAPLTGVVIFNPNGQLPSPCVSPASALIFVGDRLEAIGRNDAFITARSGAILTRTFVELELTGLHLEWVAARLAGSWQSLALALARTRTGAIKSSATESAAERHGELSPTKAALAVYLHTPCGTRANERAVKASAS